jgi:hypothetical protein
VSNHLTEKTEEKIVEKFPGRMLRRLLYKRQAYPSGSRDGRCLYDLAGTTVPGARTGDTPSLLFFVSVDAPSNESPFSSAVRASDDAKGLMAHWLESLGTVESKRVTG